MTAPIHIGNATLYLGDCIEVMRTLPDASVDSIVTDPPYELGFMGKTWDASGIANNVDMWREALRVLKPGAHLLAFSGSRTYHRMACAIEDAGFEVRDQIMWIYGSGFPKSLNVSNAIDKYSGGNREVVGTRKRTGGPTGMTSRNGWNVGPMNSDDGNVDITLPSTDAAKKWDGWGTALKPAHEPICVARKPLSEGTVAANVLRWGAGALNVDGCRLPTEEELGRLNHTTSRFMDSANGTREPHAHTFLANNSDGKGRWPANVIHDGSPEVLATFQQAPGQLVDVSANQKSQKTANVYGAMKRGHEPSADSENDGAVGFKMKPGARHLDTGSAARFFYCAKTSRKDRHEGLPDPGIKFTHGGHIREVENAGADRGGNHHPTVKPTDLMAYLCRLVTPPGGTVLDPFMGSGSTGKSCALEGFKFIGIDMTPEYVEIARARISFAQSMHVQKRMFA